jgi:predicted DNA-binding transcriptional regulator AlpA
MQDVSTKEYLRPMEVVAMFGIGRTTLYNWMKDEKFPKILKPSKNITLINKKEFEKYLELRNKTNSNAE